MAAVWMVHGAIVRAENFLNQTHTALRGGLPFAIRRSEFPSNTKQLFCTTTLTSKATRPV